MPATIEDLRVAEIVVIVLRLPGPTHSMGRMSPQLCEPVRQRFSQPSRTVTRLFRQQGVAYQRPPPLPRHQMTRCCRCQVTLGPSRLAYLHVLTRIKIEGVHVKKENIPIGFNSVALVVDVVADGAVLEVSSVSM